MAIETVGQNSVVVAHQVNPTIFTPDWCAKQHLIPVESIKRGSIISPALCQLVTDEVQLVIVPDRIQLLPLVAEDQQGEVVARILGGIVDLLPHTPYSAAGMNFGYIVRHADGEFAQKNRQTLVHQTVFTPFFQDDNARFGAYYSQDYFGARLKLDVKPSHAIADPADQFWNLEFNFHKDVNRDNACSEIKEFLGHWNEARALSRRIASALEGQQ